jgi:hypothetical protein
MSVARGVAVMLEEHWDTLEGDWALHFHRDLLADVFGAPIGVRRLRVLIEALPRDSATARAAEWPWTDREELAASSVELLAEASRSLANLVAIGSGKKYQPKEPALTVPRPWVQVTPVNDRPPLTREGMRAAFNL